MPSFQTATEWTVGVERAPDGSLVRPLARLAGLGSVASFELPAGTVSAAVQHATVAEVWYVLSGAGQLWRRQADREEITPLRPGVCATLPAGTAFQFRADPALPEGTLAGPAGMADPAGVPDGLAAAGPVQPLRVLGVTMPPWPGADEARPATGPWSPGQGLWSPDDT